MKRGEEKEERKRKTESGLKWTYHIPEPESPLNLLLGVLHTRERLLTNLKGHRLRLLDSLRIRIPHPLSIINMRQRIQIHLRQHPESCIDFTLEWEAEVDVQEIFPILPCVMAQEHVQGSHFEEGTKGPGERPHEGVEHEQFS